MKGIGIIRRFAVAIVLLMVFVTMESWGFLVHRTVHQLAVYELPGAMAPFFYRNMEDIVTHAPRPDLRRNVDKSEATKHFIDLEMYGKDAVNKMPLNWNQAIKKYTRDSLLKYGYVPYYVVYMKGKLTEAFRRRNKDSILYYAADLGHYISDANVPLHTTINYDGQLTDQKGLHGVWESMIPELEFSKYNLYSAHKAVYLKNPQAAIWTAVRRAAALVPELFAKEKEVSKGFTDDRKYRIQIRKGRESKSYSTEFARAYAAALKTTINDQLLNSANLIADFWYTSWVDAGKPDLAALTTNWSVEEQAKLANEINLFKNNKLLENKQLLAKKAESKEKE